MTSVRIACLQVPLFPLAARLRSEPELEGEALAVLEGQGHRARVVAATRAARRGGVRPGMSLLQARALLPSLVARGRDPECERAAGEALLEVAEGFSPRVEEEGEGRVYLDLTGIEHHFPTETLAASEEAAGRAVAVAADAAGVPVWVGIAASKLAARVAAEGGASPTVVPSGEEARFLAPLPLERLSPEVRVAAALERWGIRSAGELARLPEAEVASRLGAAGRELHATARGVDPRPLTPRRPPPALREGMDLEWPLVALEPFLFVARSALDRLCRRLEGRGLACRRLELDLRLEPDGSDARSVHLPAPTNDARALLTLVRLDLEGRPPGAAVAGFVFTAHPNEPRTAQLSLLGPEAIAPDRLATTVARLFALLGPGRVGSPRAPDGHRPERFELVPYDPPPPPPVRPEPRRSLGLLTVRVLRPPVPLEVLTTGNGPAGGGGDRAAQGAAGGGDRGADRVAEPSRPYGEPQGPPSPREGRTGGEGGGKAPSAEGPESGEDTDDDPEAWRLLEVRTLGAEAGPRIGGRVRVAAGPWRLEEGWWSDEPVERDYWDVELAGGGLYRIYRDRRSSEWWADGVYD